MSILKQIGLTIVLVTCAAAVTARYYPASNAALEAIGVPEPLITLIARQIDTEDSEGAVGGPSSRGLRAAAVTTVPVSTGMISTQVRAVGTSEALRSVSAVPLDTGVLTEVAVRSGDLVAAGDVLARLNSDTEEIARDRAALTLRTAENTYARYEKLSQSSATSQADLDTLLSDRDDAALALREAEVVLEQRTIFAPIAGIVGIVPVEVGDYVTTDTEIAMIDDRSRVVVDFWVPERFAGRVAIGQQVRGAALALSGTVFLGSVDAIGSRVETDSRTLQVRASIDNTDDLLRPGMSFSVSMAFEGETYPSVDPLAVQWDADGSYVWVVADEVAKRTPARIVQRNAETVLIDGDVAEGVQVITEGTLNVRDGAPVAVQGATQSNDSVAAMSTGHTRPAPQAPSETEG